MTQEPSDHQPNNYRTGRLAKCAAIYRIAPKREKSRFLEYVDTEMYRIVPVIAGQLVLHAAAGGESATSPEARAVHQAANEVMKLAERSQALFGEKAAALSHLAALATEYAEQGWDGENAVAIDSNAVLMAERFLRVLPNGIRMPEFAPEPDGSISLDWIQSRTRLFSLSISRGNRLAYAWLDGTDKGHGVARFDGQIVPPRILEGIRSIVRPGHAGLRAA